MLQTILKVVICVTSLVLAVVTCATAAVPSLPCTLPKPGVVVVSDCNYTDGFTSVSSDCQRMHFGLPLSQPYNYLPPGNFSLNWYDTFAEQLTIAVASHPPWGLIHKAIKSNLTKSEFTSELMEWQTSHHLIVTIVLGIFGLGCTMFSAYVICRLRRSSSQYQMLARKKNCHPAHYGSFLFFTICLVSCIILLLVASVRIHDWDGSHSGDVIDAAHANLDLYINNTVGLASNLVNDQFSFMVNTAMAQLDKLGHLVANQAAWLVFNATNDVTVAVMNVVNESRHAVQTLNSINRVELVLKAKQKAIQKQLSTVHSLIAGISCTIGDVVFPNCSVFIDTLASLQMPADYRHLPNVTRVAFIAKQVYDSDISAQASAVWPKFQGIPCEIQMKTAGFLVDAKKEIVKLHKDVLKKVDGIFIRNSDENRVRPSPGLVRDLNGRTHPSGAVLPSNAVDVDSSDSDDHSQFTLIRTNTSVVEMFWEDYTWKNVSHKIWNPVHSAFSILGMLHGYRVVAVILPVTLLLLLALIPCAILLLGPSPTRKSSLARGLSVRLGHVYISSAPTVVGISLLCMGVVYLIAGTAEVFCRPIRSMEVFNETIDDVPDVFSDYVLSKYVLPADAPPMTVRQLLEACQDNASLYKTLKISERVDIHGLFNITKIRNMVYQHLSKASSAFTIKDQRILTISAQLKLLRLHSNTSGLKSISFAKFDVACKEPILSTPVDNALQLLYQVMNEVSLGDNINSSYPDYEHELQQVSLKLVTMRRELAVLSTLVTDVRRLYLDRLCKDTEDIKRILSSAVDQIPKTLDLADNLSKTLQAKAPNMVQALMEDYAEELLQWATDFFNFSVDVISNKLGNCKPVADVWGGLVATACGVTPSGLNTLYVLMLVCVVLCLPISLLIPKVVTARRRYGDTLLDNMEPAASLSMDEVGGSAASCVSATLLLDHKTNSQPC